MQKLFVIVKNPKTIIILTPFLRKGTHLRTPGTEYQSCASKQILLLGSYAAAFQISWLEGISDFPYKLTASIFINVGN